MDAFECSTRDCETVVLCAERMRCLDPIVRFFRHHEMQTLYSYSGLSPVVVKMNFTCRIAVRASC